ncbi:hypothetical protein K440DRAFT_387441 [Wilcoxina mikolae CBS 423.85]|nr:hypothetical protein K440DRAFT_387441 [Wilcoxina mikolae CBS 423.85]
MQASAGPHSQQKPECPKQSGFAIRDQPPPRKRRMGKSDMDAHRINKSKSLACAS